MAFQVRVRINKNTIKVLSVATSSEDFQKLTIGNLKQKALPLFPGVNASEDLRVIFGQSELEDNETFESCSIEHLSLLVVVLRMPGGMKSTLKMSCSWSQIVCFASWINVLPLSSNCADY